MTAALASAPRMIVHSDLLGPLEVEPDELIQFPAGLLGFPECRSFVLVPTERDGMFWLQSAEHAPLAFLLVDPFPLFDGYSVDLSPADDAELQASDASDVVVLAIVTLPASRDARPSANLQGPVAINLNRRYGKQLVLADTRWGMRCTFEL